MLVTFLAWKDWDEEMFSNGFRAQGSSHDLTLATSSKPMLCYFPCITHPCLGAPSQLRQHIDFPLLLLISPVLASERVEETCSEGAAPLLSANAARSEAYKCLQTLSRGLLKARLGQKKKPDIWDKICVNPDPEEALGLEKSDLAFTQLSVFCLGLVSRLESTTHFQK